jgi:hypothetical protein
MSPAHLKAACALTLHPPQSKTWRIFGALLAFLALTIFARAQSYSIDWYKVAGGGGTSTGATYQVTGTVGQPDASGAMSGGPYSVTGGFWSLIAVVQTAGAPALTITHSGDGVTVSWPLGSGGYALQQNSSVANPAGWSAYGGTVSTNNGVCSITLTAPTGTLFFRLKAP